MNDNDIELRLERLLGSAPVVPAPESLRQAILDDRAIDQTAGTDRQRTTVRPAWIWRRPRVRAASALLGLAATLVLAAGLLTFAAHRPAQPPASGAGRQVHVEWTGIALPAPYLYRLGSMTQLGGKLVASLPRSTQDMANPDTSVSVWSYDPETSKWVELASPDVFLGGATNAWRANINGLTPDGHGGLFAYGSINQGAAEEPGSDAAMVWHSEDGRSWEASDLGPGTVDAVFVRSGGAVAVGDFDSPAGLNSSAVTSWASTDLKTWTRRAIAEPPYFFQSAVEWNGRLVVAGTNAGSPQDPRFWISSDGVSWQRIAPSGFPTNGSYSIVSLTAGADRLLAFNWDDPGQPPLISSDGVTWRSGTRPSAPNGQTILYIAAAGGTLLALGSGGAVLSSPDGEAWTQLPQSSWFGALGKPYVGVPSDAFPGPTLLPKWFNPIVAGDLIAVPEVTLNDGSYGFLLGTVFLDGPAPSGPPKH
jgi:hypothetical protein